MYKLAKCQLVEVEHVFLRLHIYYEVMNDLERCLAFVRVGIDFITSSNDGENDEEMQGIFALHDEVGEI